MDFSKFMKITPINGFSEETADARQNDYAWAMSELGEYLYVGTGRNIPNLAFDGLGLPVPASFLPNDDYRAEIWRVKKDGSTDWELDFKTTEKSFGFRFMIQYPQNRISAKLYTAATSSDGRFAIIYRRTERLSWSELARLEGGTSRSMVEHLRRLYVATVPLTSTDNVPRVYVLNESESGFDQIALPAEITGEITSMISIFGHLYIGLAKQGGFEVWRTIGSDPSSGWQLVVDKGAGDAINIIPFEMTFYNGSIFLGTGMVPFLPLLSGTPVITKGFDIVRIGADDQWQVVVGSKPLIATDPVTGTRNEGVYPSGFGNPFNAYCWQIQSYGESIYAGSFDWSVVIPPSVQSLVQALFEKLPDFLPFRVIESVILATLNFITAIPNPLFGFGLWKSDNGFKWETISTNGLGNGRNYGVRNLFPSVNGDLFLGTANPFQGCEVWVKSMPMIDPSDDEEWNELAEEELLDEEAWDELAEEELLEEEWTELAEEEQLDEEWNELAEEELLDEEEWNELAEEELLEEETWGGQESPAPSSAREKLMQQLKDLSAGLK
ncbi:hypothetical protein LRR81_08225 [Metabacillus sp. GX 13764]|uniref:hypothetical protein n=1 Tax=Metabacillus kandeliae TaxID=2900151 RepID=UPI001E47BF11|nr:hypothetical protein [Metabacillus kandeliae]MCD7034218.1 hypothetical protein [Metabacillus kandeliae]